MLAKQPGLVCIPFWTTTITGIKGCKDLGGMYPAWPTTYNIPLASNLGGVLSVNEATSDLSLTITGLFLHLIVVREEGKVDKTGFLRKT